MNIGLFFGSFNPIHVGHLVIANYMVEFTAMEQLWFVVSPQNPLKEKKSLLADYHRYELVLKAIGDEDRIMATNIEFNMPIPSYTIDTLTWLTEKHPKNNFSLVMGSDQLSVFHKWKNHQEIIRSYHRYVYPRPGIEHRSLPLMENASLVDAPMIEISSSFIRQAIKAEKDIRHFLPPGVWKYIQEMNFYK
ncbi:MAG: nicotinate-nucleotide adenylyltransferase [Bacteroidales bacterium]|nr:nicotinate-nucleotide adenylyltransferase [Bacteroidales bacterium]